MYPLRYSFFLSFSLTIAKLSPLQSFQPSFLFPPNDAVYLGSGKQLRIEAPFVAKTKAEIVKTGLELGVPYELTWSCYEGGEKPCGVCGTCRDRQAAFLANGIADPLL